MNKEIVIAIAHEASPDMTWYAAIENPDQASPEELAFLMRFAALVEQRTHTNNKARWYQEGVEAEREAIIKFLGYGVDLSGLAGEPQMQMFCATLLKGCADSIRSRGNT